MSAAYLAALFLSVSQTYNLPPGLLSALCWTESNHAVTAVHLDDGNYNSIGICQIQLPTARLMGFRGKESGLKDPKVNVRLAGKYLAHQLRRYRGNLHKGIASYNSGTWTVDSQGVTRNVKYVNKVFKHWEASR